MLKRNSIVTGTYNEYGYEIVEINKNGQIIKELYQAGNNSTDSAQSAPLNSTYVVNLDKIKEYAEKTCKEIAKELKLQWYKPEYETKV